jgi:uncharacterized lipoprotein YddW (UPF0748 family)
MAPLLLFGLAVAGTVLAGGHWAVTTGYSPFARPTVIEPTAMRGAWLQEKALRHPVTIDAMLDRAAAGGFNAIFANVFADGQTLYQSALAPMSELVAPDFDPLAYLVPAAHSRGIAVHAWFAVGAVGDYGDSPILLAHPEWGLVGPDGQTTGWLNFTRPDVRQFVGDLMLEVVSRYNVDGLHFDYLRYPGGAWGFDPYSVELSARESGLDLDRLRYAELPAYGGFDGNPLVDPETAEVLAWFDNGLPAVALNRYGAGEVLLLNWSASERTVAAGSEIMRRGLARLVDVGGSVYALRSQTNARDYGYDDLAMAMAWLDHLGWQPREVSEGRIGALSPEDVLVLPNIYLIAPETARALADFVRGGGGLIFIDGPTRAMGRPEIRSLTGMRGRGRHYKRTMLMTSSGDHTLIPNSGLPPDLAGAQALDERWKAFRMRGVSALIRDVYARAKVSDAGVMVSATVGPDRRQLADEALQDWPAWLDGGYIDMLIPRGYVDEAQLLGPSMADWRPLMQHDRRITLGLKTFRSDGKDAVVKSPIQMLAEIRISQELGSHGVVLFDIDRVSDAQLRALAAGPFATPAAR